MSRARIGLVAIALIALLAAAAVVLRPIDSDEAPSYDELASALVPVRRVLGVDAEPERVERGGQVVGEDPIVTAVAEGVVAGKPEVLMRRASAVLADLGYDLAPSEGPSDPQVVQWQRDGRIWITVAIGGSPGHGTQSVPVSITAEPSH